SAAQRLSAPPASAARASRSISAHDPPPPFSQRSGSVIPTFTSVRLLLARESLPGTTAAAGPAGPAAGCAAGDLRAAGRLRAGSVAGEERQHEVVGLLRVDPPRVVGAMAG